MNDPLYIENLTHISESCKQAVAYIRGRQDGSITSLKTPWKKFNDLHLDGMEWRKIIAICGMSGSGKTMIVEQLNRELFDLNPEQAFAIIDFNFEMPSMQLQLRNIVGKMEIDSKTLLSANGNKLDNAVIEEVEKYTENDLGVRPVYYAEHPRTAAQYKAIVKKAYERLKVPLVIVADHSGLFLRNGQEQNTVRFMEELAQVMLQLKKEIPCIQIILSQLNREIEAVERRRPKSILNYPDKTTLRDSDAIHNAADTVLISHCPHKLNFIGKSYGPQGLSTNPEDIYWHFIKTRDGDAGVAQMRADFKNMRVVDRLN